jgi:DNA-binding MarR family transcriptional regulator
MPPKNNLALRKAGQQYAYTALQMHETIARRAGFAGTDHKYLGFFLQKGELTAGELAALAGLTTGAVTGLIDRFEKKGLVKRQFDKADRRKVVIVSDTEKIKALFAPYYKPFQKETDKLIASFTEEEIKTVRTYLEKATELMKATTANWNQKENDHA